MKRRYSAYLPKRKKPNIIRALAFILASFFIASLGNTQESITFYCTDSARYQSIETIYNQAFERLNIDYYQHRSRSKTILNHFLSGESDGLCGRIYEFNENSRISNLVRVNVPIMSSSMQLWSHDKNINLSIVSTLSNSKLIVGAESGVKWAYEFLLNAQAENILMTANSELGLKMLASKKLDLFILPKHISAIILQKNPEIEHDIHFVGTLEETQIYPYLHRKYQHIIPALEKELQHVIDKNSKPLHLKESDTHQP